jgi:3-oxoacyl-ACP reductase-like protein
MTLAHAIEDAGIERAKAERVASAIVDLIHDEVATKADVAAVKADVAALSADLRRTEISLKADIPAVRGELKADAAAVRADLALVEHRLLTRLGGLIVVAVGVLFAALHYWPPH